MEKHYYSLPVIAAVFVMAGLLGSSLIAKEDQYVATCRGVIEAVAQQPTMKFGSPTIMDGEEARLVMLKFSSHSPSRPLPREAECYFRKLNGDAEAMTYADRPVRVILDGKSLDEDAFGDILVSAR